MTTRESLHRLLDELSDAEVEALANLAREQGLPAKPVKSGKSEPECIDARQYPVLAAVWDNDDDAVFDSL